MSQKWRFKLGELVESYNSDVRDYQFCVIINIEEHAWAPPYKVYNQVTGEYWFLHDNNIKKIDAFK